jgi:hypothetical protein
MTEPVPLENIPELLIHVDRAEYEYASQQERAEFEHCHRQLIERGYVGHGERATAPSNIIDLSQFADFSDYISRCRKVHKGNAVRNAIRAGRSGYYSRFFNRANHLGDILAIAESGPERQGHPLPEGYFLTVEEQGGYPASIEPERVPTGALGWERNFGMFRSSPGHQQGSLLLDRELVAHAHMRRYADAILLNRFIGHTAHLANGIIYKMHFDLVERILTSRTLTQAADSDIDSSLRGVRYLVSGGYAGLLPDGVLGRTGGGGLLRWKLRVLYRPGLFRYEGD